MFFESFDKIKIVLKPGFRRAFFDTLAVYKLNVGKFNSQIDYHLMNRATVSCFELADSDDGSLRRIPSQNHQRRCFPYSDRLCN